MKSVRSQQRQHQTGGHGIKINGQWVNNYYACIVYKCADCFGDLERSGAGLRCKGNHEHRRFVHRDEVAELRKQQAHNVEALEEFYQIIDGKVTIKCQS